MTARVVLRLRVITANVEGYAPSLKRAVVRALLEQLRRLEPTFIACQEMWDFSHRIPFRRLFGPPYRRYMPRRLLRGISEAMAVTTSDGWAPFRPPEVHQLHPSAKGVDARQFLVERRLKNSHIVTFIDVHFLPTRIQRPDLWHLGMDRLVKFVRTEIALGHSVVVAGDFNASGMAMGTMIAGQPVKQVEHTPDHIFLIAAHGYEWEVKHEQTIQNASDHDAVLADVELWSI